MVDRQPKTRTDSDTPSEIAEMVESQGVTKAAAPVATTFALGVMAGAFVALGGVFATTIGTHADLGFGPTRLLMGLAFSLGIILVIVAGSELFTGNNLLLMSLVSRNISPAQLVQNWGIVYVGNLVGALGIVALVYFARWWTQDDDGVGALAVSLANNKVGLSADVVFARGVLANVLVCLAVWLAMGGRGVVDKSIGIVFPITAFVAAGFEHSVANMYFIPMGLILEHEPQVLDAAGLAAGELTRLNLPWALHNLLFTTLGNIVGGGVFVGLLYWYIYLRGRARGSP